MAIFFGFGKFLKSLSSVRSEIINIIYLVHDIEQYFTLKKREREKKMKLQGTRTDEKTMQNEPTLIRHPTLLPGLFCPSI